MMTRYKKILVPYDGSDHARRALSHAVDLVRSGENASLLLATVFHAAAVAGEFDWASMLGKELLRDAEEKSEAILADGESAIPADVPVKTHFEVGAPGPVLVKLAADEGCDLIVMGSRGLGPLKGIFMGSVSSWLVSRAAVPVLIIK